MLVADILGSAKFDEIKPSLDECLLGKLVNYQHWIDTPKEGKRYFNVHYQPAVDLDGSVFGIVADVRDLTDLKLAEQNSARESDIFNRNYREHSRHDFCQRCQRSSISPLQQSRGGTRWLSQGGDDREDGF